MTARQRWGLVAAACGVMLFIAYGSFVPFEVQRRDDAPAAFAEAMGRWLRPASRADFLANVALGVPLGFCLMGTAGDGRRWLVAGGVVLFAGLFAAAVEFGQLFVVNRFCSGSDVLAQAVGAAAGVAGWLGCGRWVSRRVGRVLGNAPLLFGYAGLVLLAQTLPLDLTASPYDLLQRLKAATWVPFGEMVVDGSTAVAGWAALFALFAPLGGLVARRWRLHPAAAVGLAVLVGVIYEGCQVFVESRFASMSDVIVEAAGVVAGWGGVTLMTRNQNLGENPPAAAGGR